MLTKFFGWVDILLIVLLALSLTYCNGSPSVIKPETKYSASLVEGMQFPREGSPIFIKKVIGMGGREDWGRWSVDNELILEFSQPLPRKFTLEVEAKGFGPNVDKEAKIVFGKSVRYILLKAGPVTYSIPFENEDDARRVEIIPPLPTAPNKINSQNLDFRRLGVGLISLKIKFN